MGTGILERHVAQDGPLLGISDDLLSDSPQRSTFVANARA